jgi:hypothetical protein
MYIVAFFFSFTYKIYLVTSNIAPKCLTKQKVQVQIKSSEKINLIKKLEMWTFETKIVLLFPITCIPTSDFLTPCQIRTRTPSEWVMLLCATRQRGPEWGAGGGGEVQYNLISPFTKYL